jgi:hypothetical protein
LVALIYDLIVKTGRLGDATPPARASCMSDSLQISRFNHLILKRDELRLKAVHLAKALPSSHITAEEIC